MTYDEHTTDDEAGPIASQAWFVAHLKTALAVVPKSKALVGIGSFTYPGPAHRQVAGLFTFSRQPQPAWPTARKVHVHVQRGLNLDLINDKEFKMSLISDALKSGASSIAGAVSDKLGIDPATAQGFIDQAMPGDQDGDGNPLNDVTGMIGKMFGKS
jgi:hypothetical protein